MAEIDEQKLLDQAVIDTEKEIAVEAWGKDEPVADGDGDHALETMGEGLEGRPETEDEEADESTADKAATESDEEAGDGEVEAEVKAEADEESDADKTKVETKPETKPEGRVPSGKLREANERARQAESEREQLRQQLTEQQALSKREIDAINAKFDGVLALMKQQSTQPKPEQPADKKAEPALPDLFDDPTAFANSLKNDFRTELSKRDQEINNLRINNSMAMAHVRHGDMFLKATEAASKLDERDPKNQEIARQIYTAADPGETLIRWYKQAETLREVGDDPIKYKEKVIADTRAALAADPEFRKQLLDSLRAEASVADNGEPNTITRLPKSLNGIAGGNARQPFTSDDSDQAIAESAWR